MQEKEDEIYSEDKKQPSQLPKKSFALSKLQWFLIGIAVAIAFMIGLNVIRSAIHKNVVDSGTCGDNLTWTLDQDGVLTISGNGEIGLKAFWDYDNIKSVTIKKGVTSIGGYAFYGCSNLTSITIPSGVTSIGDCAFSGCSSLTSITIPSSVTSIGYSAFGEYSRLEDVYYAGTKAQWNAIDIGYYNSELTNAAIHYNNAGK